VVFLLSTNYLLKIIVKRSIVALIQKALSLVTYALTEIIATVPLLKFVTVHKVLAIIQINPQVQVGLKN